MFTRTPCSSGFGRTHSCIVNTHKIAYFMPSQLVRVDLDRHWCGFYIMSVISKPQKTTPDPFKVLHVIMFTFCIHLFTFVSWLNLHFTELCGRFSACLPACLSPVPSRCFHLAQRHTKTHTLRTLSHYINAGNSWLSINTRNDCLQFSIQGLRSGFNHAICMAGVNLHICQKCCKCILSHHRTYFLPRSHFPVLCGAAFVFDQAGIRTGTIRYNLSINLPKWDDANLSWAWAGGREVGRTQLTLIFSRRKKDGRINYVNK